MSWPFVASMPTDVPVQHVLFTVFQSITEVFLLCLVGFALSFNGIVDKPTSKVINRINIAIFTPALLFSKVAFFLTPAKLRQLWVIPIFFVVVTGLSAVVAHCLARAFHLKRSQVNFATAASMFMNSNSLPVALMQSLATTVPTLKWGPDDTVDAMFGRSLTYLVVFSTLGMILRWSYGIHLFSQADEFDSATPASTTYRDADDTDRYPALTHITADPPAVQLVDYETETETISHVRIPWHMRHLHSRHPHPSLTHLSGSHPHRHTNLHSRLPSVPTSLGDRSESDDNDEIETTEDDSEDMIALRSDPIDTEFSTAAEDPTHSPSPKHDALPTPRWERQTRSSLPLFTRLLNTLTSLSPPLIASLLAIFCVLVPPVQQLLKSDVMIPFKGALSNAGGCSVPLTLIVLGGWFWDGETKPKAKGKPAAKGEVRGGSNGRSNSKSKGKNVEERQSHGTGKSAVPTLLDEWQGHSHTSDTENALSSLGHHGTSRDSSTTSLSAMIGAFGDVLMARVYPRGGSGRGRLHTRGNVEAIESDVERGPFATRTATEDENADNELERSSTPPSPTSPVNGHARLPPTASSSLMSQLHSPKLPHVSGKNPPGETLTIFSTLVARMIIVPLIVTPVMVLVSRLGWGGQVFEDPVFIVSSMLLVSSPPALTLAQISQRAKTVNDTGRRADTDLNIDAISPFERLLSRTVFWAYCVLTPPVTMASVLVGLLLVGA